MDRKVIKNCTGDALIEIIDSFSFKSVWMTKRKLKKHLNENPSTIEVYVPSIAEILCERKRLQITLKADRQ